MSITVSTPVQIFNAPTNNSPSKAQYSFPKAARFKENRKSMYVNNSHIFLVMIRLPIHYPLHFHNEPRDLGMESDKVLKKEVR